MKQQDATPVLVGDTTFYIRPVPAFKSANIFGQLTKTITPVAGGLLSLVGGTGDEESIFDLNLEEAAPALAGAVSGLSGTVVETLLRQLLVDYGNIAYDDPETGATPKLTMDKANELFCGEVQDMFILAVEVIKVNYNGFFKKLAAQFGSAIAKFKDLMAASSASTETSTPPGSES